MRRNSVDWLFVLLGVAVLILIAFKHRAFFHDDAYITLRYARTFAETGLVQWNEGEWAEGYTSILHVWLTGWLIWFGLPAVSAAVAVNAVAALGLLVATSVAARAVMPEQRQWLLRALTVLSVAGSTPIAVWILGGLEAVVVASLLMTGLAALLLYLRDPKRMQLGVAMIAFSLAVLARLDASVFVAGAGLGLLLAARGGLISRFGVAALIVGVPAAVAFVQMGVRWNIYGELFPLTFYAKTDLPLLTRIQSGWTYLVYGLIVISQIGAAVAVGAAFWVAKRINGPVVLMTCTVLLPLVYLIWAGGDHMPWGRMHVPLIAPASLLLLALVSELERKTQRVVIGATAVAVLAMTVSSPPLKRDNAAFIGEIVGHHIEENWPKNISIALNTAGSTPFLAGKERIFIDMLGLNDPVIAKRRDVPLLTDVQLLAGHAKGDGAYVLSRAPDRIIIGPASGTDVSVAWFLSGIEMDRLPEFARCYQRKVEEIEYSEAVARLGISHPNPIKFIYYHRICP